MMDELSSFLIYRQFEVFRFNSFSQMLLTVLTFDHFFFLSNKQISSRFTFLFLWDQLSRWSWWFKGGQGDICRSAGGKSVRVRARRAREHGPSRTRGHVASLCRRLAPPFPATPHQRGDSTLFFANPNQADPANDNVARTAVQNGPWKSMVVCVLHTVEKTRLCIFDADEYT